MHDDRGFIAIPVSDELDVEASMSKELPDAPFPLPEGTSVLLLAGPMPVIAEIGRLISDAANARIKERDSGQVQ
jgi:hypothetical protein